jgi:ANTAR domain-containing protein/GAF domain-containing protein
VDGELLSETFVELTDTMVAGFDVIDFLHVLTTRSVQLLDVDAAGLLLADPRGELRVVAASSEAARLLELFQLQADQGPCLDCYRTSRPVTAEDLAAARRWPRFAAAARDAGFSAVQALPMRLRDQVIGALRTALDSRVVIEQAKGILAERLSVDMNHAFSLLRDTARSRNLRLSDLARALVDGTQALPSLTTSKPPPQLPATGRESRHPRPGSWRTP